MCGRFSLSQPVEAIAETCELTEVPTLEPRYNIAPTQPVPVILLREQTRQLRQPWLNPEVQATELLPLLRPYPSAEMTAYPVGTQVNNPKNNIPECTRSL